MGKKIRWEYMAQIIFDHVTKEYKKEVALKDISFTVSRDEADEAVKILEGNLSRVGGKSISCNKEVAKVSIVGAGMMSNPGVAAKMFEALYNQNININMISTSEIRVTVLIHERDAERAANAVHDAFGLEE